MIRHVKTTHYDNPRFKLTYRENYGKIIVKKFCFCLFFFGGGGGGGGNRLIASEKLIKVYLL